MAEEAEAGVGAAAGVVEVAGSCRTGVEEVEHSLEGEVGAAASKRLVETPETGRRREGWGDAAGVGVRVVVVEWGGAGGMQAC